MIIISKALNLDYQDFYSDPTTVKELKILFNLACEDNTLSFAQGIKSHQKAKLIKIKCSCVLWIEQQCLK